MGKMTFEENLHELEGIVGQLEKGNASLEDSITLFEKGMKLSKECTKELDKAENRVKVLVKNEAGGYQLELLE